MTCCNSSSITTISHGCSRRTWDSVLLTFHWHHNQWVYSPSCGCSHCSIILLVSFNTSLWSRNNQTLYCCYKNLPTYLPVGFRLWSSVSCRLSFLLWLRLQRRKPTLKKYLCSLQKFPPKELSKALQAANTFPSSCIDVSVRQIPFSFVDLSMFRLLCLQQSALSLDMYTLLGTSQLLAKQAPLYR